MNKLTADKCREDFEKWASTKFDTRLLKSDNGDYKLTALQNMWLSWQESRKTLEIALPVLEQQGGWISCSDRLADSKEIVIIFDGRDVGQGRIDIVSPAGVAPGHQLGSTIGFFSIPDPWGETRCNPIAWQPLPAPPKPKPSTTPQIDNDGWIEWGGGDNPAVGKFVQVKYRDGMVDDEQPSASYRWHQHQNYYDIIAYRVIENDGREG
jgi:hypothetical protein